MAKSNQRNNGRGYHGKQDLKTAESRQPAASKPSAKEKFDFSFKNKKLLALIPFAVAVIIYTLVWTKVETVVQDPWYEAIMMVDSSQRVKDPQLKQQLMDKGGNKLRQLVIQHPYHARVHFFLGYYYFLAGNWDSTIIQQKEAYRIDSGSTINSVWPDAINILSNATMNKANTYLSKGQVASAKHTLLESLRYTAGNPFTNKMLGNIYLNLNATDSALYYYNISTSLQPDADVLNNMGVVYLTKKDYKNAVPFLLKALELKPDNKSAKANLYNCYLSMGDKASAEKLGMVK